MIHRSVRRALAGPLQYVLSHVNGLPYEPRDFQKETLEKFYRWLMQLDAGHRAHIVHATGLGKTFLFSLLVHASEHLRVLVVEPSKLLVRQTVRELKDYARGTMAHASSMGDIKDEQGDIIASHWKMQQHDLLVVTDEMLKKKYAEILATINPGLVIVDECHWLYTEAAQNALTAFPEAVILGLTATPDYLTTVAKSHYVPVTMDNGQILHCPPDKMAKQYFGDLIDERRARWGIQNEWLAPLAWGQLEFKFSLDDIPTVDTPNGPDYDPRILQQVMRKNWPFVIDVVRKLYRSNQGDIANRYSVAVCPGVEEAIEIAEALRKGGIDADYILGTTPDEERDALLAHKPQFRASVFVLREGWNDERAEVGWTLRPMRSYLFYEQFIGRILRRFQVGSKVALALDPHYHDTRFAPLSAPVIYGIPGQQVRSGEILVGPGKGVISPYIDLSKLQPVLKVHPIHIEYWAGRDGLLKIGEETWGNIEALSRVLRIDNRTLLKRLKGYENKEAWDSMGKKRVFFRLEDGKEVCKDLLLDIPHANEEGLFDTEGHTWGTYESLARLIKKNPVTLQKRVPNPQLTKQAYTSDRRLATFLTLAEVQNSCADLLEELPTADVDGALHVEGELWYARSALIGMLNISGEAFNKHKGNFRTKRGYTKIKKQNIFYALSDVEKIKDRLKKTKGRV